jgi:hypothetical protein
MRTPEMGHRQVRNRDRIWLRLELRRAIRPCGLPSDLNESRLRLARRWPVLFLTSDLYELKQTFWSLQTSISRKENISGGFGTLICIISNGLRRELRWTWGLASTLSVAIGEF